MWAVATDCTIGCINRAFQPPIRGIGPQIAPRWRRARHSFSTKASVSKFLGLNDSESAQSAYDAYARRLINRRLLVPAGRVAKAVEAASQALINTFVDAHFFSSRKT